MEHQDFNTVVFKGENKNEQNKKQTKEIQTIISQKETNKEEVKIEADKKLGQLLSQARLAKGYNKQSDFVNEFNSKSNIKISLQLYTKWESNKDIPTNEQIAKMEKVLGVKLPRNKKTKIEK
jgi:ribosome-binding protein aMBF1 (putative translation factor)